MIKRGLVSASAWMRPLEATNEYELTQESPMLPASGPVSQLRMMKSILAFVLAVSLLRLEVDPDIEGEDTSSEAGDNAARKEVVVV